MKLDPTLHSMAEKRFLGVVIPAGTGGPQSLALAMDAISAHPNVGPFIGAQLIQRLVASNPSPAYVRARGGGLRRRRPGRARQPEGRDARRAARPGGALSRPGLAPLGQGARTHPALSGWARAFGARSSNGAGPCPTPATTPSGWRKARCARPACSTSSGRATRPPPPSWRARAWPRRNCEITDETSIAGCLNFLAIYADRGWKTCRPTTPPPSWRWPAIPMRWSPMSRCCWRATPSARRRRDGSRRALRDIPPERPRDVRAAIVLVAASPGIPGAEMTATRHADAGRRAFCCAPARSRRRAPRRRWPPTWRRWARPRRMAPAGSYKGAGRVFLYGGNDPYNTIVPYDEVPARPPTRAAESSVPREAGGHPGMRFALGPIAGAAGAPVRARGRMAVALNVGPLVAPTSKADYVAGRRRCRPLFSHNDQQSYWQALAPEGASSGWAGRLTDLLLAGSATSGMGGRHRRRQHGAAGRPPFLRLSRRSAGIDRHRPAAPRALRLRSLHRAAARSDHRAAPAPDGKRAGGHRPALDRHGRAPARCAGRRAATAQLRRRRSAAGGQLRIVARIIAARRPARAAKCSSCPRTAMTTTPACATTIPPCCANWARRWRPSRRNWTGWGWPIR